MSNNPKILLAAPINVVKAYCLFDWLKAIKELDYDNYDIFLVDNSTNPAFSQQIRDLGFDCVHDPPQGRETRYLLLSGLNKCKDKFLSDGYDILFSLECDIFPPKDIIQRLLAHDKDVVGTTYWTFHGYDSQLQLLNIYTLHTDYKNHKKEYKNRYMTFEEAQLFMDGSCKPAYANGIGCMLIKKWVLEDIPFRVDPTDSGHPDSFFHQDLWLNGITNYVDTSIIPLHRNSNWNTILGDTGHKKLAISKGTMEIINN
jgi:hypothetical protein